MLDTHLCHKALSQMTGLTNFKKSSDIKKENRKGIHLWSYLLQIWNRKATGSQNQKGASCRELCIGFYVPGAEMLSGTPECQHLEVEEKGWSSRSGASLAYMRQLKKEQTNLGVELTPNKSVPWLTAVPFSWYPTRKGAPENILTEGPNIFRGHVRLKSGSLKFL